MKCKFAIKSSASPPKVKWLAWKFYLKNHVIRLYKKIIMVVNISIFTKKTMTARFENYK